MIDKKKLLKLAKMLQCFQEIQTEQGVLVSDSELEVGVEVFTYDENEELIVALDGIYTKDNIDYVVENGFIKEIREKEFEIKEVEEEVVEQPKEEEMVVEEQQEEPIEEEPKIDEEKEALIAENEELKAKIVELEAKIADMEKELEKPIDEPIEETKLEKMSKEQRSIQILKNIRK